MPAWHEAAGTRAQLAIGALIAAGFALTLWVFYPGVLNYDSRYVYSYIAERQYGDWQSPVLTLLWSWIDPIAPGSASLFLLIATIYWLAFAVLAFAVARTSAALGIALPLLALTPPPFVLVGMLWRDVLCAVTWLLAAALIYAAGQGRSRVRVPVQAIALALLCLGVLLRPNALLAGPLLAAYILWPTQFAWKRVAVLFVPAALALLALVQVVYYGVLGAKHEHPLQSIMVFDLGGISHFSKENQFPGTWTPDETAQIVDGCYQPVEWDAYWTHDCTFVMQRLERDNIFGSPQLTAAWWRAVTHHPIAYAQHRLALMWNFLTGKNRVMFTRDLDHPDKIVMGDNAAFMALKAMQDALLPTPVFRAGIWLALCVLLCGFAWRQRDSAAGAFALGVCGSAVVYLASFLVIGVASDYRYAYWAVLAGIAGAVVLLARAPQDAAA